MDENERKLQILIERNELLDGFIGAFGGGLIASRRAMHGVASTGDAYAAAYMQGSLETLRHLVETLIGRRTAQEAFNEFIADVDKARIELDIMDIEHGGANHGN